MIVRKLQNRDWTFGGSGSDYLSDSEAIAQNIATRLRCFKYDCFADREDGINWFDILGRYNNEEQVTNEIIRRVTDTLGVVKVNDVSVKISGRHLTATISYNDIYTDNLNQNVTINQ